MLSRKDDIHFLYLKVMLSKCDFSEDCYNESQQSVTFANNDVYMRLSKPHGRDIMKPYQIDEVIQFMRERDEE